MPDLNLDEIEQRCEKATKEPWRDCKSIHGSKYRYVQIGKDEMYTTLEMKPDDARFIAHARTDIPALVAEVKELREEAEDEKRHRVYYQDIVYSVCCAIDAIRGRKVSLGEGLVCGTADTPTRQVQDAMRELRQQFTAEKSDDAIDEITERLQQSRTNALEEAAKICDRLKVAECLARHDEDDDIWNDALDQAAEKIRALKTNKGE